MCVNMVYSLYAPTSRKKKFIHQHFDPRWHQCYLTGYSDPYSGSNALSSCHIIDEALLSPDDPRRFDPEARLKLQSHIHHAWDQRLINFRPEDGQIISPLSDQQLKLMGIHDGHQARLHPLCLSSERIKHLSDRITDYNAFRVAVGLKKKGIKVESKPNK